MNLMTTDISSKRFPLRNKHDLSIEGGWEKEEIRDTNKD